MDEKGYKNCNDFIGKSLHRIDDFGNCDLLFHSVARNDASKCIHCNLCYIACEDTAHQCIDLKPMNGNGKPHLNTDFPIYQPEVREKDCVGCALCSLVCPVEGCISMVTLPSKESKTWNQLMKELPQPLTWESLRDFQKKHGIEIH